MCREIIGFHCSYIRQALLIDFMHESRWINDNMQQLWFHLHALHPNYARCWNIHNHLPGIFSILEIYSQEMKCLSHPSDNCCPLLLSPVAPSHGGYWITLRPSFCSSVTDTPTLSNPTLMQFFDVACRKVTIGLSHIIQETAMVNHECDMLMHGQAVTQRLSEIIYMFSNALPWHSYVTKIP